MLFLTHARQDVALALRISAALEEHGSSTWIWSDRDSGALADPASRGAQAVGRADAIVVLISISNAGSAELVETVRVLQRLGVRTSRFFPVLVGGLDESAVPLELQAVGSIELRSQDDATIAALAAALLEATRGPSSGPVATAAAPAEASAVGDPAPGEPPQPAAPSEPPPPAAHRSGWGSLLSAAGGAMRSVFERVSKRRAKEDVEAPVESAPDRVPPPLEPESAPAPVPAPQAGLETAYIEPPPAAALPAPPRDPVRFSLFAPSRVAPGESFLLHVWAYLSAHRAEVLQRGEQRGARVEVGEQGPVALPRGVELEAWVEIEGFGPAGEPRTLLWIGEPANATFELRTPLVSPPGRRIGTVLITCGGVRVTRLDFELEVGARTGASSELSAREERVRSVFASYAGEEREEALRIRRALEPLDIDVFVDVLSLRQGDDWEKRLWQEIPARDRFYLLWSSNAARSRWVEREWRCALSQKGLDFIEPVSLSDPRDVPPPSELEGLHFNSATRIAIEYEQGRNS